MLSTPTKRLSRALYWVTILLAVLILSSLLWLLIEPEEAMQLYTQTLSDRADISAGAFRALGLAWFVLVALGGILLWHMAMLFRSFGRGEALAQRVVHHVQSAGRALLTIVVYRLVLRPIEGVIVALWSEADAQNSMTLSLSSQDLTLALGGVLVLLLGRVLQDARMAMEENRAFV